MQVQGVKPRSFLATCSKELSQARLLRLCGGMIQGLQVGIHLCGGYAGVPLLPPSGATEVNLSVMELLSLCVFSKLGLNPSHSQDGAAG